MYFDKSSTFTVLGALASLWLGSTLWAESPEPTTIPAAEGDASAASSEASEATPSASEDAENEKPEIFAEIVVTSTLPELLTGADLSGNRVESSGENDLGASLREVAGLGAIRRGPINLDPVVRGLNETQVAAMVDGTRTYAAGPGRMDSGLSHLGLHDVEEVRMVKGPYALSWGSGALSAIDLVTRKPSFDSGFDTRFGSSWDENAERSDSFVNVAGGGERWRFYLGGSLREGNDYEAGDGTLVPGDYRSAETRWRFGFRPSEGLVIDYSGGYQHQEDIDYPGRLLDATYFYTRSHSLDFDWSGGGGAVQRVHGQIYANRKDHLMNNNEKPTASDMPGRVPPFGLRVDLPTESNTAGARFRVDLAGEDVSWSFGADATYQDQTATRLISRRSNDFLIFRDIVWPDAEIDTTGIWAQRVARLGRLRLGATVRFDDVASSAGEVSDFFRANASGELDQEDSSLSAAVSAHFELDDHWQVRLGLGQAVRSPTALERYSDRFPSTRFQLAAEFMGTPTLDPEIGRELDLGFQYRKGSMLISIDGFYREIEDYITIVPDPSLPKRLPLSPPTVFRYINGDASFVGAELMIEQRANPRFSWRADLGWLKGDDETLDEPAVGIQPLEFGAYGRYTAIADRLWLDVGIRITDDQDRVASSRFEQPTEGATVVSLGADLRLGAFLVQFDAENLTDETYSDHLDSPVPFTGDRVLEMGRTFRLGLRADL